MRKSWSFMLQAYQDCRIFDVNASCHGPPNRLMSHGSGIGRYVKDERLRRRGGGWHVVGLP